MKLPSHRQIRQFKSVVATAHRCIPFLAAELSAARCHTHDSAPLPRQPKTRVRNFCHHPSGRHSSRRRDRSMFTPGSRWCGYKTVLGRPEWPNRDPLADFAFFKSLIHGLSGRQNNQLKSESLMPVYSVVHNDPIDKIDPDGRFVWPGSTWLPEPPIHIDPPHSGPNYSGCENALTESDRSAINDAIHRAERRLQGLLDGTIPLPNGLTTDMASCLLKQYKAGFTFHCAGPCNPICWFAEGLAVPYSGTINLCVGKIKGQGGDVNRSIALLTFHEMCHSCGKWGHESPDGPYDWGAWLTGIGLY